MSPPSLGEDLVRLLGLRSVPVAIAFRDTPPDGLPKVERAQPAGCGYWRLAAEGRAFYTDAADHLGCPIGAHTHGVAAPPEVQKQLGEMLSVMSGLGYLRMAEVPSIPARKERFGVALYAPLSGAPFAPDLVLVRGTPRQLMLLQEAAQAADVAGDGATLGRPTCAVLPQTLSSQRTAMSLGCVGNRVYTGAPDDEAYLAIPAAHLEAVVEKLAVIDRANTELLAFHRSRADERRGAAE
jgi:uncharacterized protein (DUF169 family)